jgi:hypothetical protein
LLQFAEGFLIHKNLDARGDARREEQLDGAEGFVVAAATARVAVGHLAAAKQGELHHLQP